MSKKKPTVLMILDGYGLNDKVEGNAVKQANTPVMDDLMANCPFVEGQASGMAVGLPEGQMGNSEVGHLNMGAGRIVYQELTRITKSVQDGDFFENEAFLAAAKNCKENGSALHLMGLVSDGGVHSHINHIYGLLEFAKRQGLDKVFIHCFLDGRDTPPASGKEYVTALMDKCEELGVGQVASVMGRYYAMDRDNRWDRVEKAYRALRFGEGKQAKCGACAIQASYDEGVTDEFVVPTVVAKDGEAVGKIQDKDSVIFFNFRPDRAREMTHVFCDNEFTGFNRGDARPDVTYVCFTDYDTTIPNKLVAFNKEEVTHTFGEFLAENGLKQARSAYQVCDKLVEAIKSEKYDVIIINFANPDMVGHTGVQAAAIKAVETVDECVGKAVAAIKEVNGQLFICADHGNAEQLIDYETGEPFTAHTTNPVPFILVNADPEYTLREGGCLADIAPTLIELMGMEQPKEMTGKSLLIKK